MILNYYASYQNILQTTFTVSALISQLPVVHHCMSAVLVNIDVNWQVISDSCSHLLYYQGQSVTYNHK